MNFPLFIYFDLFVFTKHCVCLLVPPVDTVYTMNVTSAHKIKRVVFQVEKVEQ